MIEAIRLLLRRRKWRTVRERCAYCSGSRNPMCLCVFDCGARPAIGSSEHNCPQSKAYQQEWDETD